MRLPFTVCGRVALRPAVGGEGVLFFRAWVKSRALPDLGLH
jgi:hypothetical protein